MSKVSTIFVALAACVVLAGVAAAATTSEPPDAGSTWSTAKNFDMDYGFNYVNGHLSDDPVDQIDMWKSNDPSVGDRLDMYLDSYSYDENVVAELFDGNKDSMQRLEENNNSASDYTLDAAPAYVRINGDLDDWDYTFIMDMS
jgi:hypothetical protein